jgi:hypothetical protein
VLQLSQHIALFFVVTAFWHVPHGHLGVLGPGFVSVSEEFAISNRHRYNCTFLLGLYLRYLVTLRLLYRLQFLFGWCRALEKAIKGKRSVGHLSSMFSVDKVLLGECSMLNTELVIAKIQKQIFHIPDFFFFLSL